MGYTLEQYNSLCEAIATGANQVRYGDKTVVYNSLKDMRSVKAEMELELFPTNQPVRRKYAEYSNGVPTTYPDWSNERFR